MSPIPVIAVFDIGKTNKKFFLFNEQYKIVLERTVFFEETSDEDGFPCDDLPRMEQWALETIREVQDIKTFAVKALNVSAYGASFVLVGAGGVPVMPLYNYLKSYPQKLQQQLHHAYGGETGFSLATASPALGNLNSGLQLYRLKKEKNAVFDKVQYALHLPQYISYLFTHTACSDITSIGCHTALWDFTAGAYHAWVKQEGILSKLGPLFPGNGTMEADVNGSVIKTGAGLHDSSAALIPYLKNFSGPFILLSTGTWCISLNPFNEDPLTPEELQQDCLYYMRYDGHPVKASRLFAGHEHEQQVKKLATHFGLPEDHYKKVLFDAALLASLDRNGKNGFQDSLHGSVFEQRQLGLFGSYEQAYHQLVYDIMQQQHHSTSLVLGSTAPARIFVDGGFAQNPVYMNLLAAAFPEMEVFAASVSQASAIGAALAIHECWNDKQLPGDMVELKFYKSN